MGKGPMPSLTLEYCPLDSNWVTVPSAAEVSMVMPYLPLPIPSRLSYWSGPVDGLVVASPEVTSCFSWLKMLTAVGVLNTPEVARAWRPFLLFTNSWLAVDSQVSRCQGSSTRPMPLPAALSVLASATICDSVSGGLFGLRPAFVNAFWL